MEDAAFQNTYRIFYAGFHFGLTDFCWHDDGVIVFCPFCVILIQDGLNPVLINQNSLLAV